MGSIRYRLLGVNRNCEHGNGCLQWLRTALLFCWCSKLFSIYTCTHVYFYICTHIKCIPFIYMHNHIPKHSYTNLHVFHYTHTHSYTLTYTHTHLYTYMCIHTHLHTELEWEHMGVIHVSCPLFSFCSRRNSWPLDLKPSFLHRSQAHILLLPDDSYIVQKVSGGLIHCRCYYGLKRTNGPLCYLFRYPCLSWR